MNDDTKENEMEAEDERPAEGWVQVPVLRGIFEVEPVLRLCALFGGRVIGGYARFCCSTAEKPGKAMDVDVFPIGATMEDCKATYENLKQAFERVGYTVKNENNVSLTFDSEKVIDEFKRVPTLQLIKPIDEGAIVTAGTLEEVLSNFDFTIVRIALDNEARQTATAWASFAKDERQKKLRILNIHCPISSLLRVMKYGRKGYYMRPVEALRLFADWTNRTPEYRDRMLVLFQQSKFGKLSQTEIDELEALLRID